jgi:acyl-CoA synthetase (NDP forming)
MQKMFYPESVMVYGVSGSPNNLGRNTVENLERFGFKGSIYLVGREGSELNGRKIYRHIEDIDAVPDLAVFLIPAKAIPDVMERCGRKGIPYAVIQSAGFSEFTEEGRQLEEKPWKPPENGISGLWDPIASEPSTWITDWFCPLSPCIRTPC